MEKRAFTLSVGLSLFAMYLVYQYVETEESRLEELYGKDSMTNLVVASRDILQYQTIRPTDLAVITVPRALRPTGQIFYPKDVFDAVAAIPIKKGEFILDNKVVSKNVYSGLDTQISLGKRAISVPVNDKTGVGFHLRPGNRVDLAARFEYRAKNVATDELKVFMQDILVLAVGRTIQTESPRAVDLRVLSTIATNEETGPTRKEVKETLDFVKTDADYETVTLELTPPQAQMLIFVMSIYGAPTMFLRNPNDRSTSQRPTTNLEDVMGKDSYYVRHRKLPPPRAMPQPQGYDFVNGRAVPFYGTQ